MRIPLAWLTLVHNKRRLVTATAGILGAVVLMFVETGFMNAMLDSQVEVIGMLDADLVVVSRLKVTLIMNSPFPRRRLYQALSVDGVAATGPVYVEFEVSRWRNPADGRTRLVRVLGIDPDQPSFANADLARARPALRRADTVAFDRKSRVELGAVQPGLETELAGQIVRVVDVFSLGADLANDGNVVMSDTNFAKFFPYRARGDGKLESAELGVVKLAPGADPAVVRPALQAALGDDVRVMTKAELVALEMKYWTESIPIGVVFGMGAAMGFAIGVMICYQILFTDVTDQLPQFATLKAIGYGSRYLVGVVMQEALLLSVLAFVPGVLVTHALFQWLAQATSLHFRLTPDRIATVFAITVGMTAVAGLLAVRKAVTADPAEMFR